MNKLLEKCLFVRDRSRFSVQRSEAIDFRTASIGDNIVRDGIFEVLLRYAETNKTPIRLLSFPVKDEDVWAFTCVKEAVSLLPFIRALHSINKFLLRLMSCIIFIGTLTTKKMTLLHADLFLPQRKPIPRHQRRGLRGKRVSALSRTFRR